MDELPATVADLEALRGPLTGYCYRLLGSAADAEDAVQEAIIRAAARLDSFDPRRAALTTWVHRIATNICLDMLRAASRRALPVDLSPAATGGDPFETPLPAERFVEPMPDARLHVTARPGAADPDHVVEQRETVRLAFIDAFESHNVAAMVQVLRTDAIQTMPPVPWMVTSGRRIAQMICANDACAHDRMLPITINGTIGAGQYRPDEAGVLRPFALVLLETHGAQIAQMITFLGTGERFAEFGLTATHTAGRREQIPPGSATPNCSIRCAPTSVTRGARPAAVLPVR